MYQIWQSQHNEYTGNLQVAITINYMYMFKDCSLQNKELDFAGHSMVQQVSTN